MSKLLLRQAQRQKQKTREGRKQKKRENLKEMSADNPDPVIKMDPSNADKAADKPKAQKQRTRKPYDNYYYCCASFCWSTPYSHTLFRFPNAKKYGGRAEEWAAVANNPELTQMDRYELSRKKHICTEHFEERMFMNDKRNSLVWNAVPTLFIWEEELRKRIEQMDKAMDRHIETARVNDKDWYDVTEWQNLMDAYNHDGIRSRQISKPLRKFIADIGMRPKKRGGPEIQLERMDIQGRKSLHLKYQVENGDSDRENQEDYELVPPKKKKSKKVIWRAICDNRGKHLYGKLYIMIYVLIIGDYSAAERQGDLSLRQRSALRPRLLCHVLLQTVNRVAPKSRRGTQSQAAQLKRLRQRQDLHFAKLSGVLI